VSGQVQGLAINTVGGVVTEAQQLMMIVPEGDNFEVEAYLQNKDIGFVHTGDSAEIKIHTFPFTKYGVINAKVTRISDDAFPTNKQTLDQNKKDPTENEALVYTMGLIMEQSTIRVNDKDVRLMPGMAVTVEVITGERRMIEYFMAPLLKARQESIRER
jgi:hemolysin D